MRVFMGLGEYRANSFLVNFFVTLENVPTKAWSFLELEMWAEI